jgi:type I restriction enzyme S subunit
MNNWQKVLLIDVADVKLSNVDKKTKSEERVIKLCNYTDVYKNPFISKSLLESFMIASCNDNEYEKFKLKEGQVAVTKDSEKPDDIGIPTYIKDNFDDVVLGYHLALFTPEKSKLDGQFLYHWLNTKQAKRYFENNAGGSGQRCSLSIDILKSIPLYLPKLNEQKNIAKVLSDLDAKIELNIKINQELEAMAKLLYDYWFVQFDFPNEQGKPYKSSGGKMVFNKELKREIPEGWEVKRLTNIANITTGKLDSNAEVVDGKYYFYTCAANPVRTDSFAFNDSVILIAGNNASGNFHINRYTGKFNAYQRTYIVTEKKEYYLDYLFQVLERQLKVLKTRGQGSQTKFLTIGMLTEIPVFQTSTSVMENFHKIANPLYLRQLNVLNENQKLTELRDWLLPMLMNGQVTVGEAEEKLNMAAEPSGEYKIKGNG